jgi:PAS domain S-box-containing protein
VEGSEREFEAMTQLPENELELEMLVRERTDEIAQYLAAIVESSDDAIISKDLRGTITSWNKGAEHIYGYTFSEAVGKQISIIIPADRQDEEPVILERVKRGERIDHCETVRQRKDGSLIDVSLTVSPVRNAKGEIIGASKISRDITGRKRREAELATLAREAEHRAKNILSVVQAIVQLSHADTAHELKQTIEGRIQALANVISLFSESRWKGAELQELITQELAPFCQHEAARCQFNGAKLMLEPKTAQAIAMTLHELATNTVKYGALSAWNGKVRGKVHVEWTHTEHQIVLRWIETGGPHVRPPEREGFGTRLMQAMVRAQLKGSISFDWRAEGLACEIVIPNLMSRD